MLLLIAWACFRPPPAAAGKAFPRPFSPDAVWFYDRDMQKVIPGIDLGWLTVVFQPPPSAPGDSPGKHPEDHPENRPEDRMDEKALLAAADDIAAGSDRITGRLIDRERAPNACFFTLASGTTPEELRALAAAIALRDDVRFTHPAIDLGGKPHAFLDRFDLEWKTGLDPGLKSQILAQVDAAAVPGDGGGAFRVDVFRRPFFEAVTLLAEDVRVRWAVPRLVALEPLCSVTLDTAVGGGRIGDEIPFVLTVRTASGVRIDSAALAAFRIAPAGISGELFDAAVDAYDAGAGPIRIRGRLTFHAPGDFVIPPVSFAYICDACPGGPVGSAASEAKTVRIASMIPPGEASGRQGPKLLLSGEDPAPSLPAPPAGRG
ncbi:hypothetical protein, partial [Desulfococcus sp.]|uniref:hypothetical protein n=1 Tax=Desulfococcus sp. TaxID=2025834 RepID=UPI00359362FA